MSVCCGTNASIVITKAGRVLATGSNRYSNFIVTKIINCKVPVISSVQCQSVFHIAIIIHITTFYY